MSPRKLYAEMWWCDDEECDCTQPQIIERSTGVSFYHSAWKRPALIEAGTFFSQADSDEIRQQWEELVALAKKHNVCNLTEVIKRYEELYPATGVNNG